MPLKINKKISVEGTCCPVPLINIAKAMEEMSAGEILQVTGDDPIFETGVRDYCQAKQLDVIEVKEGEQNITITIRV